MCAEAQKSVKADLIDSSTVGTLRNVFVVAEAVPDSLAQETAELLQDEPRAVQPLADVRSPLFASRSMAVSTANTSSKAAITR